MRLSGPAPDHPVGAGVLALLVLLVGLLAVLGSLSFLLPGAAGSMHSTPVLRTLVMGALGVAFLVLSHGVRRMKQWCRTLSIGLIPFTVLSAILGTTRQGVMDLASVMVFFAAIIGAVAVLGWTQIPAIRERLD